MAGMTWLSKLCIELLTNRIFHTPKGGNYLVEYTSPTIVLCSIFLFLFFVNLKINNRWIGVIRLFSPLTFGVYLIHEEPLIRSALISNRFESYASMPPMRMALAAVGTAIGIWLTCSLVDWLRLQLFNLLKVKTLCEALTEKVAVLSGRISPKFVPEE